MDPVALTLKKIYYDPAHPAAFSSVDKLYRAAKLINSKITLDKVKQWLTGQDAYTLHRSVNRKFKRVPTYAAHVDSVWQFDTADVRHLSKYNSKIKYLLMIVDVISRFAFVVPLENKSAARIAQALDVIKTRYNRSPNCVVSDPGLEFKGDFTAYLKKKGIKQILLRVEQKAPLSERFIRTIKEKMVKYMTYQNTKRYLEVLPDIVRAYNNTVHHTIKKKPIDVNTENENEVKETLYGHLRDSTPRRPKFNIGDLVRQVKKLKALEKGTNQTTTDEVFEVVRIDPFHPPEYLYQLKDMAGDYIRGLFHAKELVLVQPSENPLERYQREGTIRVKPTKRQTQKFRTYKGWPRKFDKKLSVKKYK